MISAHSTSLPGVILVQPRVFSDDRGAFLETWRDERYREIGITGPFVQDNYSRSVRGALRGLHYQLHHPQGKLVQVLRGAVFDVAVDIRTGSPTFGQWFGAVMSDENHHQLWIPPGFAHGFYALSEQADFVYKCTAPYVPGDDRTVRWDDPELAIEWPLGDEPPLLSSKDAVAPLLREAELPRYAP